MAARDGNIVRGIPHEGAVRQVGVKAPGEGNSAGPVGAPVRGLGRLAEALRTVTLARLNLAGTFKPASTGIANLSESSCRSSVLPYLSLLSPQLASRMRPESQALPSWTEVLRL